MKRCLAAVVLLGSGTTQADGMFYGLLRASDVTPFGSLRLDMRLAHALAIERGSFAFEAELAHQTSATLLISVAYIPAPVVQR